MSKINELIQTLCPDGVEWKRLGDLVSYEQPSKYIVKSTNYSDEYEVPVLTAGQSFVLGYTNEHDDIYNASPNNPVIIFDDFTGAFHWVDFPFKVKSSAMKMLRVGCNDTTLRYVYHVMRNIGYTSDEHKRLWISLYSNFLIPIPPLPVQDEIVRILDEYTDLEAELEAKLSEEIELKQKQYEVYRDELLMFDDNIGYKMLGELCSVCTGAKPKRILTEETSVDYINAGTSRSGYCLEVNCKGNVTTTPSRGQGGIGYVGYQRNDFWLGPLCYAIRSVNINVLADKYIYYWLSSKDYVILSFMNEGGTPSLNKSDLEKIEIPVPSLTEQERIVKILDKYDTYTRDMISALNTELESRKKQYAYYRDQLLTFKRKE